MISRGIEFFNKEKYNEAGEVFEKIIHERVIEKDYRTALYYLGYIMCFRENFSAAKNIYKELLEISRVEHDMKNSAIMYHQLGMVERMNGHLDKAIDYFMFEKNTRKCYLEDDYIGFSSNYYELALLHLRKSDVEKAKTYLDLAMMNGIISEDDTTIGICYKGLGDIEVHTGDLTKAKKWYCDSKRYFENAKEEHKIMEVQSMIDKL